MYADEIEWIYNFDIEPFKEIFDLHWKNKMPSKYAPIKEVMLFKQRYLETWLEFMTPIIYRRRIIGAKISNKIKLIV